MPVTDAIPENSSAPARAGLKSSGVCRNAVLRPHAWWTLAENPAYPDGLRARIGWSASGWVVPISVRYIRINVAAADGSHNVR